MSNTYTNPCGGGRPIQHDHLGGTATGGDSNSYFPELWDWLISEFKIRTMLDVGCGVGFAQKFFYDKRVVTFGIDGSEECLKHHQLKPACYHMAHDLSESPFYDQFPSDLVWCCELAEHIIPEKVNNVIETVVKNCYMVLAFCAAPEGAGGYHHVNCQNPPYWIELIEAKGMVYQPDLTEHARKLVPGGQTGRCISYFERSGLIFTWR